MLYKDSFIIAPKTFQLIQELQSIPYLKDFYLVGGTALALQLGHRNSIDIDLFTQSNFDDTELIEIVSNDFSFKPQLRNRLVTKVSNAKNTGI